MILLYFSDPGTSICPYLRVEKVITKSQYGAYPRTCPVLESIPLGISTPTIGALCLSIVFNISLALLLILRDNPIPNNASTNKPILLKSISSKSFGLIFN